MILNNDTQGTAENSLENSMENADDEVDWPFHTQSVQSFWVRGRVGRASRRSYSAIILEGLTRQRRGSSECSSEEEAERRDLEV
jgi:hypothetical protein